MRRALIAKNNIPQLVSCHQTPSEHGTENWNRDHCESYNMAVLGNSVGQVIMTRVPFFNHVAPGNPATRLKCCVTSKTL